MAKKKSVRKPPLTREESALAYKARYQRRKLENPAGYERMLASTRAKRYTPEEIREFAAAAAEADRRFEAEAQAKREFPDSVLVVSP